MLAILGDTHGMASNFSLSVSTRAPIHSREMQDLNETGLAPFLSPQCAFCHIYGRCSLTFGHSSFYGLIQHFVAAPSIDTLRRQEVQFICAGGNRRQHHRGSAAPAVATGSAHLYSCPTPPPRRWSGFSQQRAVYSPLFDLFDLKFAKVGTDDVVCGSAGNTEWR